MLQRNLVYEYYVAGTSGENDHRHEIHHPVKRRLYALCFFLLLANLCFPQREKIDSLKKTCPLLKDSAKIDCLNALSENYIDVNIDTSEVFASKAFEESEKLKYIHGKAKAVSLKATITFNKYYNYPEAENLAREAIRLYANSPNKNRLNRTYYELGHALYAQSFFEEAIKCFDTSNDLSNKAGDVIFVAKSVTNSAYVYLESGDYKRTFEKVLDLHQLVANNPHAYWRFWELNLISALYHSIEDYNSALTYVRQEFQIIKPGYSDLIDIAELFSLNKQFDSARYYYSLVVPDTSDQRALRSYLASVGQYYLLQHEYDKSLPNLVRSLKYNKESNDRNQVMSLFVNIARTHLGLANIDLAIKYAHQALSMSQETGARQYVRDSREILYSCYDYLQETDSAFFYYRKYVTIKDSITSAQVAAKLVAYDFDQKIEIMSKEKELQQAQLRNQSLVRNILIGTMLVFLLMGIVIVRNIILKRRNEAHLRELAENELRIERLENEKNQTGLRQHAAELEMQALRAQMNPHFIFNSLNSINRFILQKNSTQASEYLTKFSKLVRLILQNSQTLLIPLESELESLQLYLELEAVRFDHQFEFKIEVDDDLDIGQLKVPPLIIQPYVENAIWHGLMNKQDKGHLQVEIYQPADEILCIKISDDGIGRQKAAELKSKSASTHKSMGMRITADRIAMLQQKKQLDEVIKITDLVLNNGTVGGTEVLLEIPMML